MGPMKASAPSLPRLARTALLALASASLLVSGHAQTASPSSAPPAAIRTLGTPDFAQIVQRYGPAVVNISTKRVEEGVPGPTPRPGGADPFERFFAPFLTPGTYGVKVELAGFSPVEQKNIQVRLGQRLDLNFSMKVGDIQEVVEVIVGEASRQRIAR